MIVTRRRRKPFPWKRILTPIGFLALFTALFVWQPSRDWIVDGPAAPLWRTLHPVFAPIAAPFDAMGQMHTIASQNAQIADLQKQLVDSRSQIGDRDKQISDLQTQLNAAQQEAAVSKASANHVRPAVHSASAASGSVQMGSDLASQATPDMRRTASVWAAMDADAAAKVVERLPDDYVARIFAIMPPDSVGAILESSPASYAARLTRDRPELQH